MLVVDEKTGEKLYYVDHSTLSTFQTCKEKCRLNTVEHLVPQREYLPFTFGGAYHAGLDMLRESNDLEQAKLNAIKYLKKHESSMELNMDSAGDRRSVERCLNLIAAYHERWKNEIFEIYRSPDGKAYTEIGFKIYMGDWVDNIPVMLCGTIDAVVRDRSGGSLWGVETKTTTLALPTFIKHAKPNVQIGIYDKACHEYIGIDIKGFIWDCTYVSDRKASATGSFWAMQGIDLEKDFYRVRTTRSETDRKELMFDLNASITDYLTWYSKDNIERWPRNGASTGACHNYNGCAYLSICESNANPNVISSLYQVKEWKPWENKPEITYSVENRIMKL